MSNLCLMTYAKENCWINACLEPPRTTTSASTVLCGPVHQRQYVTRSTIEVAVSHAVLVFNSGRQAIASVMERPGIIAGPLCISHLVSQDAYRTKRAQTRESEVAKRRRKSKQVLEKHVGAVRVEAEGTTFKAGGFE